MSSFRIGAALALCLGAGALPASAHVSLEVQQAPPNSIYRAVFRVPHGCDDAPTTRLTIRLPEGVTEARPMPHAGWTLRTVPRADAPAPTAHGAVPPLAEIVWEGGSLPNDQYDEFIVRLRLPDQPGQLVHFPTVQDCPDGRQVAWDQIPEAGRRASDYPRIAPAVRLAPRN